jgi:hypothetical protein
MLWSGGGGLPAVTEFPFENAYGNTDQQDARKLPMARMIK